MWIAASVIGTAHLRKGIAVRNSSPGAAFQGPDAMKEHSCYVKVMWKGSVDHIWQKEFWLLKTYTPQILLFFKVLLDPKLAYLLQTIMATFLKISTVIQKTDSQISFAVVYDLGEVLYVYFSLCCITIDWVSQLVRLPSYASLSACGIASCPVFLCGYRTISTFSEPIKRITRTQEFPLSIETLSTKKLLPH